MKHLWSIHHINSKIDKNELFEKIENGFDICDLMKNPAMKNVLMIIKIECECLRAFIKF